MIYPLLPSFLAGTLKGGPAALGVIEGLAEALASVLKIVSGRWSDRLSRRKPLVVAGYALSTAARPLVAMAVAPWHVLLVRLADRTGKGMRSAPRDALLAEATTLEQRGRAYGFHRAMDHAGALVGPLLASIALLATHGNVRLVFALALIPGLVSVGFLVFGVAEPPSAPASAPATGFSPRAPTGRTFGWYLALLALFTLGNSSDAFLLLRAQETGVSLAAIPLLWSFHHFVKSAASTHAGALSDRLGRRPAIAAGWVVYALVYTGFACATTALHSWVLFGVYSLFHALTEGPERALVADLTPPEARGRAFGLYHAVTGAALLPASLLTGFLWQSYGAATALGTGAALGGLAALGLGFLAMPPVEPTRALNSAPEKPRNGL